MFWVWRIDLLTLPVFVAGAVAIIFGVRVLWRQKLAIGYLFLGWPYPYSSVLLRVLDAFTTATLAAIRRSSRSSRWPSRSPHPTERSSSSSITDSLSR